MSKKLTITVKGPIGVGKTAILAKIKTLILSDTKEQGLDVIFDDGYHANSVQSQQIFMDMCKAIPSFSSNHSTPAFLKQKGIQTIVLKEKDVE